ncbi:hypothetical protein EDB84DRAFT_525790 [Lactarius hengduanensis]|nr:hypothetical protein EDB84DRAFT_525790 [Lactarius hengduanensis]
MRSLKRRARARYHVSTPQLRVTAPSEYPKRVTIRKLPDEVLLNIFRYYLNASPRFWPRLVHVCRKWRRIVFASRRALHLRLFCTHGTPVLETLDCWPALPIVVQYGGSPAHDPPAPEEDDNIIAALKQSDRVNSISLTVTSPLLEKLSAIERPFLELEKLVLLARDSVLLSLPSAFRWGPRLGTLHLTRIAILALPQLLSPSTGLVDLQLHKIPNVGYFSSNAFADALSGMSQLQTLSLHFNFNSSRNYLGLPPQSGERVILPALTCFKYRGTSKYLGSLVARMDAPRLNDIDITFFSQPTMDASQLGRFIERIDKQKSHRRTDILSSEHSISISFTQPGVPARFELQISCKPLARQLLYMAQFCNGISALLTDVEHLRIGVTQPSSGQDNSDRKEWLKLIHPFRGTKWVHIAGNHSTNIMLSLQHSEMRHETVLPALYKLCIREPVPRYPPLHEAAVSFMHSRRLSGHIIGVEYERLWVNELRGTRLDPKKRKKELCEPGFFSQKVTIDILSDDILLNTFRHYLDAAPQFWTTLACVSHRWRQIVFTSPLGLNLRLYCTYGTPVLKALDFWPALPIIVKYGGFPDFDTPAPSSEDEDNIVAALKQSGRVSSISLTVTSPLLEKLSAISEPFSELENLVLLSRESARLCLPSTFRWGARLHTLHSIRVAFPSFPQLLLPSQDLVDLQLHEIPSDGYFSPEAFANALSGMTQLRTLSLHFLSFPPRRNYLGLPPPSGERVVLPALTYLKYRGTSKYLDSLVARIDASHLGDIDIAFFSQPTMDTLQLGLFIDRIEILKSHNQANIRTSEHAISISFTNSGTSTTTTLRLQISCEQSDWQLSSMAQVCDQFSPFAFRVEDLGISTTQSSSSMKDDLDGEQWLGLVRPFGGARDFRVAGELATDILCALGLADGGHTTVLPALRHIRVEEPMAMNERSWDALQTFITSRSLSGRPVQVDAPSYQCHICHSSFKQQEALKNHLGVKHAYRIVCSYCGNFKWLPGYNNRFREHLERKHPEVACKDALVSDTLSAFSNPFRLDSLVNRHSSLRAQDIAAPSLYP